MSNFINITVKDAESPAVPDADDSTIIVPDTGVFTGGDLKIDVDTALSTAIIALLVIFALVIIVVKLIRKATNKINFGSIRKKTKDQKALTSITLLFLVLGSLGLVLSPYTIAVEDNIIDVKTEDVAITVTKGDEPTFATIATEITLEEDTASGYELYVYAPEGNVIKAGPDEEIGIMPVESEGSVLSKNTWGITDSDSENLSDQDAVWSPVSDSADEPLLVASYKKATETNDKIVFNYGVLVDGDLPSGSYKVEVEYIVVPYVYTYAKLIPGEDVRSRMREVGLEQNSCEWDGEAGQSICTTSSIHMADSLPEEVNFADDTYIVSADDSEYPIYMFVTEDENGVYSILNFYTEADIIKMNPDSSCMFAGDDVEEYCFDSGYYFSDISGIADWDANEVISMGGMFENDSALIDISPLANWDVGNVEYFDSMFSFNSSLEDLSPLTGWDVSGATSMFWMFAYDMSLTDISPLAGWDVSHVTEFTKMFANAGWEDKLENVSIENWAINSSANFFWMFYGRANRPDFTVAHSWDGNWGWDNTGTFLSREY